MGAIQDEEEEDNVNIDRDIEQPNEESIKEKQITESKIDSSSNCIADNVDKNVKEPLVVDESKRIKKNKKVL